MPKIEETEDDEIPMGDNTLKMLRGYAERIERLDEERRTMVEDIKEVFNEAKAAGFDAKILRKVLARRRRDQNDLHEEDALIELYEDTLR